MLKQTALQPYSVEKHFLLVHEVSYWFPPKCSHATLYNSDLFFYFSLKHAALSEYRPILTSSPVSHSMSSMADRKLTLIPIIFIMLRVWSTIRFLLLLSDSPARQNPVLVTLHVSARLLVNCTQFRLVTPKRNSI